MKNTLVVVLLIASIFLLSCGKEDPSDKTTGPDLAPTGIDLLGLSDGRIFEYTQIDSTVVWLPTYSLTVTTSVTKISVSGSGNDWIIKSDTTPVLNLKVSDPFTMVNGYWRKVDGSDALVFLTNPAIALDRGASAGDSWTGDVPPRTTDSNSIVLPFHVAYFGFHFSKKYSGQEDVIVTDYAGSAYRYDIDLYLSPTDTIPIATVVEHFAPSVGLVRQEFRAPGLVRVLTLRSRY